MIILVDERPVTNIYNLSVHNKKCQKEKIKTSILNGFIKKQTTKK